MIATAKCKIFWLSLALQHGSMIMPLFAISSLALWSCSRTSINGFAIHRRILDSTHSRVSPKILHLATFFIHIAGYIRRPQLLVRPARGISNRHQLCGNNEVRPLPSGERLNSRLPRRLRRLGGQPGIGGSVRPVSIIVYVF